MIEIIREEESGDTKEKRGLPKDIKQMGKPDIGDRIYVENQVYQFVHPYNETEEKRAYVLLGRFENYAGRQCTFVEAAIYLEEMIFEGELPLWNDQTWAYIYKQLRKEYDSMVIVGWAMDIKGQLPNMTVRLEGLHQRNFGGAHQVLFLMDSLECEEAFYGTKNGHLFRREGYYVYYDKKTAEKPYDLTIEMDTQSYEGEAEASEKWSIESTEENVMGKNRIMDEKKEVEMEMREGEEERVEVPHFGKYRQQMKENEGRAFVPSYASTVFLAAVVCTLGIMAYLNNEKMNDMQETLASMMQSQTVFAELETESEGTAEPESAAKSEVQQPEVAVETVVGNVQKQEDISSELEETAISDAGAVAALTATDSNAVENMDVQVLTEAQTYLNQGYYIVQKGDSLVGICKKVYQTTAMLDKLCEVNGIEDKNEIYAGQKLTLPN